MSGNWPKTPSYYMVVVVVVYRSTNCLLYWQWYFGGIKSLTRLVIACAIELLIEFY